MSDRHQLQDALTAREFILGGNATVTLQNAKTGNRFTYKVERGEPREGDRQQPPWFVKVLTGADNEADYTFLGTIFHDQHRFVHSAKSRIGREAPSALVWYRAWPILNVGRVPVGMQVWHEGRCGRCNRKLTDPVSIENGFGPECRKHV